MNKTKRTWLGAALLALVGLAGKAGAVATNPAFLNIDVAITASKSVTVIGVGTSSDTTTTFSSPNQVVAPVSTVAVQNNSGVITEQWELSTNANSLTTAGSTWGLAASSTSVGADQFTLQAVFGSSMTSTCAAASWNNGTIAPLIAAGLTPYTTTALADTALATGGVNTPKPDSVNTMLAFNAVTGIGQRALCWRTILPLSTTASATQNIQLIVTAF